MHKTKGSATRTPLKSSMTSNATHGEQFRSGTHRVIYATIPVIGHERGRDEI
jgi:hypothetical protein